MCISAHLLQAQVTIGKGVTAVKADRCIDQQVIHVQNVKACASLKVRDQQWSGFNFSSRLSLIAHLGVRAGAQQLRAVLAQRNDKSIGSRATRQCGLNRAGNADDIRPVAAVDADLSEPLVIGIGRTILADRDPVIACSALRSNGGLAVPNMRITKHVQHIVTFPTIQHRRFRTLIATIGIVRKIIRQIGLQVVISRSTV